MTNASLFSDTIWQELVFWESILGEHWTDQAPISRPRSFGTDGQTPDRNDLHKLYSTALAHKLAGWDMCTVPLVRNIFPQFIKGKYRTCKYTALEYGFGFQMLSFRPPAAVISGSYYDCTRMHIVLV